MTTENESGHFLTLTAVTADWDSAVSLIISSIALNPGAVGDYVKFRVHSNGDSGAQIAYLESTDGEPRIKYLGAETVRIVLDYTGSSLSSGHSVDIQRVELNAVT